MPKEFIMRGQTASAGEKVITLSGYRPGYAYICTEFTIAPSTNLGGTTAELTAALTSATTAEDPVNPDFNNAGLVATASLSWSVHAYVDSMTTQSVVDDTMILTQDLILSCRDTANSNPVNWQIRFKEVKLTGSAEAVANYKQYSIYNTSQ
jgi:hypothetical protein